MSGLWEDITKTIRDSVDTVVEKTEELTKIGRIKIDILSTKRQLEKYFSELGGRVFHIIVDEKKSQIASNPEVKELIERIKKLEIEFDEQKGELEKIKAREAKEDEDSDEPTGV